MPVHFPLHLASLVLACIVLTGCCASNSQCQKDPPFYLRSTAVDCAALRNPDPATGGERP